MTKSSPKRIFFEADFISRLFFKGDVAVQQVIYNRVGSHSRKLGPVGVDTDLLYQSAEQEILYAVAHGKDQQKGQALAYHPLGSTAEYP